MHADTTYYSLGVFPVTGNGLGVSTDRLDEALAGPIRALICDDVGTEQITALLDGIADTEFARENLETLFAGGGSPEDWRVGEALSESYLVENRTCFFPWPDGRDERKRGSSLPGADLVGFHNDAGQVRFAFGEIKTSGERSYPPGAVYGRHGLKQQLEDLCDRKDIRDGLVCYLGHRAVNATWQASYRSACALYLRNTCDVRIFGILVRDVEPHADDLRARVSRLEKTCPDATCIELIALYLPVNSISTLSKRVAASRQNGGGQ